MLSTGWKLGLVDTAFVWFGTMPGIQPNVHTHFYTIRDFNTNPNAYPHKYSDSNLNSNAYTDLYSNLNSHLDSHSFRADCVLGRADTKSTCRLPAKSGR
jgi:hypothetical protein